jgi:hypothetical protein
MKKCIVFFLSISGITLINSMENKDYFEWAASRDRKNSQHNLIPMPVYHPTQSYYPAQPQNNPYQPFVEFQLQDYPVFQEPPQYVAQQQQMGERLEISQRQSSPTCDYVPVFVVEDHQTKKRMVNQYTTPCIVSCALCTATSLTKIVSYYSQDPNITDPCRQIFYPSFANGCNGNEACNLCTSGTAFGCSIVTVTTLAYWLYDIWKWNKEAKRNNNSNQ